MRRSVGRRWRIAVATGAAMAALAIGPALAEQAQTDGPSPGMRRVRDLGQAGQHGAVRADDGSTEAQALRRDDSGLRVEPVTAPAGGVKLNLGRRFRSAVSRHAKPDAPGGGHTCDGGQGHE